MGHDREIKISVLITSYNYGDFIEKAILSVINQNIPEKKYEIIVVDGGSTDNTEKILSKYSDKIILLEQKDRKGLAAACNIGIKAASGEYIVRLDADDEFLHELLYIESLFLNKNQSAGFVYPDYIVRKKSQDKRVCLPPFDKDEINTRGDFIGGGTMYRKELFEKYGFYNEKFRSIENYELILRFIHEGVKGIHIELPLYIYNHHGDSMSDDMGLMREAWAELKKKYNVDYSISGYHPRNI